MPSPFCEWWWRWNSPYINHFLQADTIIPDQTNPQNWNRYSYVNNNPLRYTDPTGHRACGDGEGVDCTGKKQDPNKNPHPSKPPKPKKDNKGSDNKGCNQLGMSTGVCNTTIGVLNTITIGADILGAGISFIEWGFVGPPMIGGALVGLSLWLVQPETIAAWPEAVGAFLSYDAGVASMFAPVENNLGFLSLGTTAAVDWLEGYTYRADNGDVHVGTTTAKTIGTAAAGIIPEANIDLAASLKQLTIDFDSGPKDSINVNQWLRNIFP
jgi:hypothetical protein